ncbi:Tetratricopeptide repeat protein [Corynebacterium ciconiae DSM 44920]|uniref:tetratricopeptide repeat protein n=1 Tax=Corynebacterium ciconiae TaxID=227319 RepID=UPI00037F6566|nr:tetratricopeptide repeat protein [Corynebacterium ciconiae]WKD61112.1 Tetratricopeptide repeat protein [Corynebacterium ciconiae DSM 44920]
MADNDGRRREHSSNSNHRDHGHNNRGSDRGRSHRGQRNDRDRRSGAGREGHRAGGRWEDRGDRRSHGNRYDRRDIDDRRNNRGNRDGDNRGYRGGDRPDRRDSGERRHNGGGRGGDRYESRSNGERRGGRNDSRGHAQRGGRNRTPGYRSGGTRANFRAEKDRARKNEPAIPEDMNWKDLDPSVRQDLRSLSKDNAERVGAHMVAAAALMAEDPDKALAHARAAKDRGGRVAVVRETVGIAAYHAGEWKEALSELRAARRMSGGPGLLAVMADCERGLGRPEKAIDIAREESTSGMSNADKAELAIVIAGARRDMEQYDAAVLELERFGLEGIEPAFTAARVHYAYADALIDAGRTGEAKKWFEKAVSEDHDELLDARDRLAALND